MQTKRKPQCWELTKDKFKCITSIFFNPSMSVPDMATGFASPALLTCCFSANPAEGFIASDGPRKAEEGQIQGASRFRKNLLRPQGRPCPQTWVNGGFSNPIPTWNPISRKSATSYEHTMRYKDRFCTTQLKSRIGIRWLEPVKRFGTRGTTLHRPNCVLTGC